MPIETNISIINLNENGLNISTKRHGMAEWTKKKKKPRPTYMLSTREPLQTQRHIQTESESMGKDIPCKCTSKESQSDNSHIRQNRT